MHKKNHDNRIKLIIFDGTGVTYFGGYVELCKLLSNLYNKDYNELYKIFYTKYLNKAAMKEVEQDIAWQKSLDETGIPLTVPELKNIYYELWQINSELMQLINKLKNNYKVIMLTKNTGPQLSDLNKTLDLTQYYDEIINTWDINLPKASKETFEYVLKKFNVKPNEVTYIDDQEENMKEAKKMGAKTHVYKNIKEVKNFLETLNIS